MKHIDGLRRRWASLDADPSAGSAHPGGLRGSPGAAEKDGPGVAAARMVNGDGLERRMGATAIAFRGYDVANLGRSREFLEHRAYGATVRKRLEEVSAIAAEVVGTRVDLAAYIREGAATALESFALDIATIVAMELVQLELLESFHGVPVRDARFTFGYSIGELSALIFGASFTLENLLPVPLRLAPDCASLAGDTTLGVLFTRGGALHAEDVERLCLAISSEGEGLIGPSAYLSPNTALLLGQGRTLDRVEALMAEHLPGKVMLRRNPNQWPPLHSPLVWERSIPNRTAMMLYHLREVAKPPSPTVLSCVTGDACYDGVCSRDVLVRWTDHPQRLWDVIDATLAAGIEVVIHVGPAPSLIAATFTRLENNVSRQLDHGSRYLHLLGRGLASGLNRHAWLTRLLPSKAALLRLPYLVHVSLEDWLLDRPVPGSPVVAVAANLDNGERGPG